MSGAKIIAGLNEAHDRFVVTTARPRRSGQFAGCPPYRMAVTDTVTGAEISATLGWNQSNHKARAAMQACLEMLAEDLRL
jgi:hypothetical protein